VKVLDRYLTRELFFPILFCAVSLVFLILVADLFDNLDELLTNKVDFKIIGRYYLCLMPFSFVQIISWATWLGGLFLFIHMGLSNELLAMKAAGLRINTIIKPTIFLAFLIAVLTFLISELVVPPTFKKANDLLAVHIEKNKKTEETEQLKNVTFYAGKKEQLLFFRNFYPDENRAEDAIVLWLNEVKMHTYQKVFARRAFYDGQAWHFYEITEYQTDSQGRILGEPQTHEHATYPDIQIRPRDLLDAATDNIYLSIFEMNHSIKKLEENNVPVRGKKVDFYNRLSVPFQGMIMLLITIPILGSVQSRKAIAQRILLCVFLIFAYHVMGAIFLALGKSGKLMPLLSAWASHLIFGITSFIKLERANF